MIELNNNENELILGDYETQVRDDKTYCVKKSPYYPKDCEDCMCKLGISYTCKESEVLGYKSELLSNFQQLIICRDAYWKIAGDWKPDFTSTTEDRYGIFTAENKIFLDFIGIGDVNTILTFPTEEMRDVFYENFKDLIEKCKEFL